MVMYITRKYYVFVATFCVQNLTFYSKVLPMIKTMDKYNKQSLNSMPGPVPDFIGNDGSLLKVLKTLLFFTIMMITLPIGLYFTSKSYLFEASGFSSNDSYFYAAILAVIAVHVILAFFVYVAWNEGSSQTREGKQD